jgi:putative tryptophan/tyrosine transport system substrate-binding protein
MLDLRRRDFIALLSGAALVRPLTARAQHRAKVPAIGYLSGATPAPESQRGAAFVQRLRELGWIDGHSMAIKSRWAEGHTERGFHHQQDI